MKTCNFVAVLVLVLIARNEAGAEICESCLCEPTDAPVSVTCKCKTPETILDFKPQDFNAKFKNTLNFTISNCNSTISFKQNLFRELHNLDNLEIKNVKQVIFELGVFQTLNNLKLSNIQELNFKTNAFHGGLMKSVEIYESYMDDLPQYSFHDVNSLDKFLLSDVHIKNIQPMSIMLKNNNEVAIVNSTFDNIASNAMTIEATTVMIKNSTLKVINSAGLNITAKEQFIITKSKFDENLPSNPIISKAPVVNVSNNIFKHLTPQIIKNIKGSSEGSISFINNNINEIESDAPLKIPSKSWNLIGNQFNCSCEMLKLFENLKKSEILENNYCKLPRCKVTLSQGEETCAKQSPADLADTDLCKGMPLIPSVNPREGKVLKLSPTDETNNQFTTHMPLVRTTPVSSATAPLVSLFLFWSITALMLF